MPGLDTHAVDSLAGATYFVVGRGTEGGPSSYHLSIAGVTSSTSDPQWGKADKIAANSGYSLGTIQVDLGQRGTWALGATDGAALKAGQTSYVDGIIDQAAQYAKDNQLKFTADHSQLHTDVLSHGNGERGRTTLNFIDKDTRNSINAWASCAHGQQWIHTSIDYPQIKNATQSAMTMLDTYAPTFRKIDGWKPSPSWPRRPTSFPRRWQSSRRSSRSAATMMTCSPRPKRSRASMLTTMVRRPLRLRSDTRKPMTIQTRQPHRIAPTPRCPTPTLIHRNRPVTRTFPTH